jgi:hypothetical protein
MKHQLPIESAALPPGDVETGSPRDRDNGAPGRALYSIAAAFARGFGQRLTVEGCRALCLRDHPTTDRQEGKAGR